MALFKSRTRAAARTASTRRIMIGAAAGAVIILIGTTVFSWRLGSDVLGDGAQVVQFDTPAGTCIIWNRDDAGDMRKVTCEQEHLFEVTGTADLSSKYDRKAALPSKEQWKQVVQERCTTISTEFLANRFDPQGKYGVGAIKPSDATWKAGDRILRCGLQVAGSSGKLYPTKGSAATADQSDVHDEGTCLGYGTRISDVVDCAEPHSFEIIGWIDLGALFAAEYPGEKAQDERLNQLCANLAKDYAGGADVVSKKGLIPTWDTRSQQSWEAGSRKADCKLGAKLPNDGGIAPVTGSVKGEVKIDKEPPPLTAVPNQPGG